MTAALYPYLPSYKTVPIDYIDVKMNIFRYPQVTWKFQTPIRCPAVR